MAKKEPPYIPMLATLTDRSFDDPAWVFEVKWDGYRLLAHIRGGTATLMTRGGIDASRKYPKICKTLAGIKGDAIVDGELVALDKSGKPRFELMQHAHERGDTLVFYAFDLLCDGGKDIRELPLLERKRRLRKLLPKTRLIRFSDHVKERGTRFFEEAKRQGLEGVVAKRADSKYHSGTRSRDWLKIKTGMRQEATVVGFTAPKRSRKYLGSLVLAVREGEKFVYAGHSGGGFGGTDIKEVYDLLFPLVVKKQPLEVPKGIERNVTWVKPKIVVEVAFTEWTSAGQMRHPKVLGIRTDKDPEGTARERPVAKAAHGRKRNPEEPPALTNLDKVWWPKEGYTKGDALAYYGHMADVILPYLKDRPMVLNRHPNGIDKQSFYQKDSSDLNLPPFVETTVVHSESNDKELRYILCNNKETLLYIVNLGCIELNPWNSRVKSLEKPDFFVIDLDPGDNTFQEVVRVAREVKAVLDLSCEISFPKTSGKTGMHIYVPLGARYDYDRVRKFAELLVRIVHERLPDLTSLERSPKKRTDKIYLDWLQNRTGQTLAAPYSLRPAPGATVSTPLRWSEVKKGLSPENFTIKTIFKRLQKEGDLWKPTLTKKVNLSEAIRCLEKELA
jgi:bifunctional non-homologous end joining protein LigD